MNAHCCSVNAILLMRAGSFTRLVFWNRLYTTVSTYTYMKG